MIRTDRYKLIKRYPGPNGHFGDELYNLMEDPEEEHNLHDNPGYSRQTGDLTSRFGRVAQSALSANQPLALHGRGPVAAGLALDERQHALAGLKILLGASAGPAVFATELSLLL